MPSTPTPQPDASPAKEPLREPARSPSGSRTRLEVRRELALALLPTLTVLLVMAFVEALSRQRLLFACLAGSAFLIYLDPHHSTNKARTLMIAHTLAALLGFGCNTVLGNGYASPGLAMTLSVLAMVLLDVVHPPAVSTSLAFALRAGKDSNLLLFELSLGLIVLLLLLQRALLWLLGRFSPDSVSPQMAQSKMPSSST